MCSTQSFQDLVCDKSHIINILYMCVSITVLLLRRYERGSWHRYERSKNATNGAPGLTTRSKNTIPYYYYYYYLPHRTSVSLVDPG